MDLNTRDVIWTTSLEISRENFFWGVGLGNLQYMIQDYSSLISWSQSANNFFIGWLVEAGFLSLLMFFVILILSSKNTYYGREVSYFIILVLLASQFSEYFMIYVGVYTILLGSLMAISGKWGGREYE